MVSFLLADGQPNVNETSASCWTRVDDHQPEQNDHLQNFISGNDLSVDQTFDVGQERNGCERGRPGGYEPRRIIDQTRGVSSGQELGKLCILFQGIGLKSCITCMMSFHVPY